MSGRLVVKEWNRKHVVPRVRYWLGTRQGAPSGEGIVIGRAELLGGHTPVVWIEGCRGCVALTHVEIIP